jgi:hypothetical protein
VRHGFERVTAKIYRIYGKKWISSEAEGACSSSTRIRG